MDETAKTERVRFDIRVIANGYILEMREKPHSSESAEVFHTDLEALLGHIERYLDGLHEPIRFTMDAARNVEDSK